MLLLPRLPPRHPMPPHHTLAPPLLLCFTDRLSIAAAVAATLPCLPQTAAGPTITCTPPATDCPRCRRASLPPLVHASQKTQIRAAASAVAPLPVPHPPASSFLRWLTAAGVMPPSFFLYVHLRPSRKYFQAKLSANAQISHVRCRQQQQCTAAEGACRRSSGVSAGTCWGHPLFRWRLPFHTTHVGQAGSQLHACPL